MHDDFVMIRLTVLTQEHSETVPALVATGGLAHPKTDTMSDQQSERDHRQLRIDKVGVRNLRFPVQIRDKAHELQNTVATIGLFVDLPEEFKGTHMSRFVEVLNSHGSVIHVENIPEILKAMQTRLHAHAAHLEMRFPSS